MYFMIRFFLLIWFIEVALGFLCRYKQSHNRIRMKLNDHIINIDGLIAKRVEITTLRHVLIEEMAGKPLYYYEIDNWISESKSENVNNTGYILGSFTYGAKLWPSNLGIASKLALPQYKKFVKDKVVLDMGCGVGLASIVCSILGARKVIAADISPVALKLVTAAVIDHNISNIETLEFDVISSQLLPKADIILFGDILYNSPLGKAVAMRVKEVKDRGDWAIVVT